MIAAESIQCLVGRRRESAAGARFFIHQAEDVLVTNAVQEAYHPFLADGPEETWMSASIAQFTYRWSIPCIAHSQRCAAPLRFETR